LATRSPRFCDKRNQHHHLATVRWVQGSLAVEQAMEVIIALTELTAARCNKSHLQAAASEGGKSASLTPWPVRLRTTYSQHSEANRRRRAAAYGQT
jgi:catechol-2,3-dioxygenase